MSKQQTAVEWLAEQMQHPEIHNPYIEQAIQMEKEQIVNAVDGFPISKRHLNGEQYYTETYGK